MLSLGSFAGSLVEPGPALLYSEGGFYGAAPFLSANLRKNWNSSQEKSPADFYWRSYTLRVLNGLPFSSTPDCVRIIVL